MTLKLFKGMTLKKGIKLGVRASNLKKSTIWRCTLIRGRYTIKVYATDLAGNKQSRQESTHDETEARRWPIRDLSQSRR